MKSIVRILASLTAILLVVPLGLAQSYPSKPVRIVVPWLNKDIAQLLAQPEMRDRLALIGLDAAAANSPAEFAAFIRKETELWSRLLPQAGIQPVD